MITQPASSMTLEEFFTTSYQPLKLPDASMNTIRLHQNAQHNLSKFLARPATLGDLTDEGLTRFMSWMVSRGRSPITANNNRNKLVALWNFACRKKLLDEWPNVPKFKEPERTPIAYSLDELTALLDACLNVQGNLYDGLPARLWWYALHLVLWDTGERIACVLGLLWTDADLDDGWLNARAELRKGGRADRTYKLRAETVEALRRIREPLRPEIFPWPTANVVLYYHYAKILKAAGLPHDYISKFHKMRKSVGSHCQAAGGNPSEILDHTDIRVTKRYLDPRIGGQTFAADLLPSIVPKPKDGDA